jgi:hypothetical protein
MRPLFAFAPLVLLACSSSAATQADAGRDASHDVGVLTFPDAHDATHPVDAAHDAIHDAGVDAIIPKNCTLYDASALDGGPLTVTVVTTAHLVQGMPYVDATATIPEGCWSSVKVRLTVTSDCTGQPPAGQSWPTNCDPYDRLAQVTLGDTIALADAGTVPLFVMDAVTSFGGAATWEQDVTDYISLLSGTHTYHLEVDTYAEPPATGSASSHDVSLSIVLTPGTPPHDVAGAFPLIRQDINTPPAPPVVDASADGAADAADAGHDAGHDAGPVSVGYSKSITVPEGATSGRVDFFTSGHGGNPPGNCDEFCEKENIVSVGGTQLYAKAPESNCSNNCIHVDAGQTFSCGGESFGYYCQQNPESCPSSAVAPRSNWCPSEIIAPIQLPLPSSALSGTQTFEVQVVGVNGTWPVGLSAVFFK